MRVFVAFICIALVLCVPLSSSVTHLHLALPALILFVFAVFRPLRLRVAGENPAGQPLSFLSVQPSRAPPQA